ncbi:MAG TPA: enoyl-ACP reductase [Thermomicrobiales bacterium]|nr:enoyl-ACP reductase [Thermomicrobiales bacterium]
MTDERTPWAAALAGKNCVVMGIQNRWSIAYAIAETFANAGGRIALTTVDERAKRDADALAARVPGSLSLTCNVASDDDLDAMRDTLARELDRVDVLVHSIGFAPRAAMEGDFFSTTRADWTTTLDVSAYSLVAAAQRIVPLMTDGGSIMTLTYLGADRYFPGYNVMGVAKAALEASVRYLAGDLGGKRVRVNAISAGPIKTAAARGIPGFQKMFNALADSAPLAQPFNQQSVANAALFLASDLSAAVTGETLFVDNGYHAMGMSLPRPDEP